MKIEEILQKQGELYKNLPEDKTIKEYDETIKPKPEEDELSEEKLLNLERKLRHSRKRILYSVGIVGNAVVYIGGGLYGLSQFDIGVSALLLILGAFSSLGVGCLYHYIKEYKKCKNGIKHIVKNNGI